MKRLVFFLIFYGRFAKEKVPILIAFGARACFHPTASLRTAVESEEIPREETCMSGSQDGCQCRMGPGKKSGSNKIFFRETDDYQGF